MYAVPNHLVSRPIAAEHLLNGQLRWKKSAAFAAHRMQAFLQVRGADSLLKLNSPTGRRTRGCRQRVLPNCHRKTQKSWQPGLLARLCRYLPEPIQPVLGCRTAFRPESSLV